jgi:nitrogen fixation/metabolism regulation signal transduction histidine kinase
MSVRFATALMQSIACFCHSSGTGLWAGIGRSRSSIRSGSRTLTVRDSGEGFEPQGADRLSEALNITKSTGMGIGLSVSRSIIKSHHRRLWVAPKDGPGPRVHSPFVCDLTERQTSAALLPVGCSL